MSRLVLDDELRAKLNGLANAIEVCDETGKTVGHFLPADVYSKLVYAAGEAACPYSAEELKQFRQATGGSSLKDIWQRLGLS